MRTVEWANWTSYLDFDEETTGHPTLDAFSKSTGLRVGYHEDIEDNDSYFNKVAPQLRAGQSINRDIMVLTDWMVASSGREPSSSGGAGTAGGGSGGASPAGGASPSGGASPTGGSTSMGGATSMGAVTGRVQVIVSSTSWMSSLARSTCACRGGRATVSSRSGLIHDIVLRGSDRRTP